MFDDLAAYFHENCILTYVDFRDSLKKGDKGLSKNLKLAINLATSLFHIREHLPEDLKMSRREVTHLCPDYGLIGDIANASKHKELDRGNPQVLKAEDISEITYITKYCDALGEYFSSENAVIAKCTDGQIINVGEVLTNTINFWCNYLYSEGILRNGCNFPHIEQEKPLSREQAEKNKTNLSMIQGVRFHHAIKLQGYNYETNEITPIDLTGGELKMNIYKPPNYKLKLDLVNDKTGEGYSCEVEVTNEEYEIMEDLNSLEMNQEYLQKIAEKKGAFDQLKNEVIKNKNK